MLVTRAGRLADWQTDRQKDNFTDNLADNLADIQTDGHIRFLVLCRSARIQRGVSMESERAQDATMATKKFESLVGA